MSARGVAEALPQDGEHGLDDLVAQGSGGVVIEIDPHESGF